MISSKVLRAKSVGYLLICRRVQQRIMRQSLINRSPLSLIQTASYSSSSSYNEAIRTPDPPPPLTTIPKEIQLASDALDEKKYPVGELSVEDFLELEENLKTLCGFQLEESASKSRIQHCFLLLRRLIQEHEANPDILEEYRMTQWLGGNHPRCTKLLHQCLRNWTTFWELNPEEEYLTPDAVLGLVDNLRSGSLPLQVQDRTFRILIEGATRGRDPQEAPLFADRLLETMLEESLENPDVRPSGETLKAVLNAWARSGLPEAPEKVDALFNAMCKLYEDCITEDQPDVNTYIARMQAWKNSRRKERAERLGEILETMKDSPFEGVEATAAAYRLALHEMIFRNDNKSIEKAFALFVELVREYMTSRKESSMIDADFFSAMISTLAKAGETEKALEIFDLMEELHKTTKDKRFEPTTKILLGMVIVHAKCNKPGSAEKADSILLHLEDLAQTKVVDKDLPPKRGYYYDVIRALAKDSSMSALESAERVLSRMVKSHRAGYPNMLPDAGLFDLVITGWSKSKLQEAPLRAEKLLWAMNNIANKEQRIEIKPNEKTYMLAMTAWARSKDPAAPNRAEILFFQMLDQYNKGDSTMKPSMSHYTVLINSWTRSGHPDAAGRAQSAFESVLGFYKAGDKSFEPDAQLYNSLMSAWAAGGDASTVESVFLQMFEAYSSSKRQKLMPTTGSFDILLDAHWKSGHPNVHKKAKLIYDSMIEFSEEGTLNVRPDFSTYRLMIDIMASSELPDGVELAESYLEAMKADPILAQRRGRKHPDIFGCYASAIQAWSGRSGVEANQKVESLTNDLINLSREGMCPLPSPQKHRIFLKALAHCNVPGLMLRAQAALKLRHRFKITPDLLPPP